MTCNHYEGTALQNSCLTCHPPQGANCAECSASLHQKCSTPKCGCLCRVSTKKKRKKRSFVDVTHTCAWGDQDVLDFSCEGCTTELHTGGFDDLLAERLQWARQSALDAATAQDKRAVCTMCLGKRTADGTCSFCVKKYTLNELNEQIGHARTYALDKEAFKKELEELDRRLRIIERLANR